MNRRNVLKATGSTIVAGLSMGLAGCTDSNSTARGETGSTGDSNSGSSTGGPDNSDSSSGEQTSESNYDYVESGVGLTDIHWNESEYGNVSLAGTATNLTDSTLSYIQISVSFLDSSGAQIGTGLANTNNLAANQRWKWEAMFLEMDTSALDNATITGIDAY